MSDDQLLVTSKTIEELEAALYDTRTSLAGAKTMGLHDEARRLEREFVALRKEVYARKHA